ncbi:hypothetical protein [Actinomycetospora termitidis]|uniref:Gas vesicle protein n=1 Tax=Actinomycetospora termitidis TaxID=3053470 RepID=A0ABT7MIA9_9PSEU|nr:hypothetical protein [Actinomycetospora sp. Odt1-22]MDL5160414.1 hypothetical protein [Actinomycetospora sp. Odt1-22]
MSMLIVGLVLGLLAGVPIGRRVAEFSRGRHDARQAWQGRARYRQR